ncbi:MAG: flagellar assembly peptidoglycan hydrolase FlgJ, partial [Burkholderiaceae bacterium]|nr:flagellar assembly peptidoglycan hydrolase FlgJ [Burkholderiaceae bacterium]
VDTSVFDMKGLASLKRDAKAGATTDTRTEIARQFEALYLQMMLKRMREATPKGGLLDSDQMRMVQSMGDEQLAMSLSKPGIGLAQALLRQMEQGMGAPAAITRIEGKTPADADAGIEGDSSGMPDLRDFAGADDKGQVADVTTLLGLLRAPRVNASESVKASDDAPDHVADFVGRMSEAAQTASMDSGVPARLILSQAALESGWGRREIKFADGSTSYNVFGIKAGESWKGRVAHVMTTEYIDGEPQKMLQPFRAYNSYAEAFSDYARLIGNSPRYEQVTQTDDAEEAARRIHRAGYATDPRYAEKLIGIMEMMRGAEPQQL